MLESHEWCGKKWQFSETSPRLLQDGRSDSVDIERIVVSLNLMSVPQIKADAIIHLTSKVNNLESVRFDLEGLTVDSVVKSDVGIPFSQSGASLLVDFPQALQQGQQVVIIVSYHGVPPTDASGWGGFYNQSGYTFNLGVGFAADPHSYGRAWIPCFDNFVERFVFQCTILSPLGKPGYSNGFLIVEDTLMGGIRRSWRQEDPIPSYLACFAIGSYTSFKRSYPGGLNGQIPVEIAAVPSDTVNVRNTFKNLPKAIEAYEYWFGPYRWDKIGYSLVPFNSGAMEHATNIAIGRSYINGSLNFETLWAHELSHHWWGDLATCSTAEDMWLNEGWASYCEHLFTEKVYGTDAFRSAVRANHLNVLQNAHVSEGGYRAVSGVPHSLTYGTHVYNKGASVAHNLRAYLGDSLFQVGCRYAMANTQFDDWSSADFRDKLETATGKDLDDFFEDWVFSGGYPDFSIDSIQYINAPLDEIDVYVFVKQKLRGAPHLHHNVPLELTVRRQNGAVQYHPFILQGETGVVHLTYNAFGPAPTHFFINTRQKLLQARVEGEKMIKTTGTHNFSEAKWSMNVNSTSTFDSVFFRVEHHFAAPDNAGANPNGYVLSNRYWVVGNYNNPFPPGFIADATLQYDGRGQLDQLDTELFAQTSPSEDSVLLLYRTHAGEPWQEWPDYTKITFASTSDKWGQIRPNNIQAGEYTIGKGVSTIATHEAAARYKVKLSPNPATRQLLIQSENAIQRLTVVDAEGQTLFEQTLGAVNQYQLGLEQFPAGHYWLVLGGAKSSSVHAFVKK